MIDPTLQAITSLLYEDGESFDFGCDPNDVQRFIRIASNKYPNKPYCTVKNWVFWDLKASDALIKSLEAMLMKPVLLHARFVMQHEVGESDYGHYRISTPLIQLDDGCFFVTKNTVYILIGRGTRKTVDPKIVRCVYF